MALFLVQVVRPLWRCCSARAAHGLPGRAMIDPVPIEPPSCLEPA
ncbi:MAG TPA: hypothetical protein PKB14_23035 [Rubrivivax sp.]|nr:hypothetical protein [Rubrivivax sp.]